MININDKILDVVDENELYLLCQIARHFGATLEAWPGMKRLTALTGWGKSKVIRVRNRVIEKQLATMQRRKNHDGSDASPMYRLKTPLMGVYLGAEKIAEIDQSLGVSKSDTISADDQQSLGVSKSNPGVSKSNPQGAKIEPKVLTNEVLTISTTTADAGEFIIDFDGFKKIARKKIALNLDQDSPELRSSRIEEAMIYYKDNPMGQAEWQRIRVAISAQPGQVVDCAPTVISAGLKVKPAWLTSPGKFRQSILGFARKQISIDAQAVNDLKNASDGKSKINKCGRATGANISNQKAVTAAEAMRNNRNSRVDPLA